MEGDGEGMVAIVQGLDSAGVTLTVVNRRSENTERRRSPRPKRIEINSNGKSIVHQRPSVDTHQRSSVDTHQRFSVDTHQRSSVDSHQRSSVETSTDRSKSPEDRSKTTTGVQICDGRYASSYRLAHCQMMPSSPPERVSEFPPQRREPCRNQGNFEVGGHGSGHGCGYGCGQIRATWSRSRHYGGSQTWGDRGPVSSKSSRATDDFVHSLRKYPSLTPVSTASSDLIEKLIKNTQAKNSHKSSRPTKSMRSLYKDRSSDTHDVAQVSKHQQTYTRTRQNNNDNGGSNMHLGYRGRTKNFKLYSPMSDSRNIKYREAPFSSSYDYLKVPASSSRRADCGRPERAERDVRLTDVSRYIRSTLRQMCQERPLVFQVCPKLQSRYIQHKKTNCPVRNTDAMMNDEDDQASVPTFARLLAPFSGWGMPSTTSKFEWHESPEPSSTYCYCNKAAQCSCNLDASTSTSLVESKIIQLPNLLSSTCCPKTTDKSSQGTTLCITISTKPICVCSQDDKAYYDQRIDEEIYDWLTGVPVHSVECAGNKSKRERLLYELGNKLKDLPDDENFEENAKNEIADFLKDFPMWYPVSETNEEQFKQQLGDKLLEKILNIPRKPDRIKDAVKKWVKDLNFQTEDGDVDTDAIIVNFVDKLKALAADRPDSDDIYKDILKKEIFKMLEELPLKIVGNKVVILNTIANKLARDIVLIPRNIDFTEDSASLWEELAEDIFDWLDELDEYGNDFDELIADIKSIKSLAKKLDKLQSHGIDDEIVEEKMKNEIYKFMSGVDLSSDTLDELVDDLMDKVKDTIATNNIENLDYDELSDEIIDWLQNILTKQSVNTQKIQKIAKEISLKIQEAKLQGHEDYEYDIIERLADAVLPLDLDRLRDQIEILMEILQSWPSKKKYKENAKEKILSKIDNIIDASPILKDKKRELRNKIPFIIADTLDSLDFENDLDDVKGSLLEDVDNIIDKIQMPSYRKSELKDKVGDTLMKQFCNLGLKKDGGDVEQTILKCVRDVMKKSPIDIDQKLDIRQQIKHILAQKLHKPLPDDFKDAINEGIMDIVEQSPISEDNRISSNIKNRLSVAAMKRLDSLPVHNNNNKIGDIQNRLLKGLNIVIEALPIDVDKKNTLNQNIQNILNEHADEPLSVDTNETVKEEILKLFDDLAIPADKNKVIKQNVNFAVTNILEKALARGLRYNMCLLKKKICDDVSDAIEKAPLVRNEKNILKKKFKSLLSDKLNTLHTNEVKEEIIEDISNIVNVTSIPEDKKRDLKNKLRSTLARKLNVSPTTAQRKYTKDIRDRIEREMANIIDETLIAENEKSAIKNAVKQGLNVNLGESINIVKDLLKEDIYDVIENSPITRDNKQYLKTKFANVFANNLDELLTEKEVTEYEKTITQEINSLIHRLSIDSRQKKELKQQITQMLTENLYRPLSEEVKTIIKDDVFNIIDEIPILEDEKNSVKLKLGNVLGNKLDVLSSQIDDTGYVKNVIAKDISHIIDKLSISNVEKDKIKQKVKSAIAKNIDQTLSENVIETIKRELNKLIDDLSIPEDSKKDLKIKLANIIDKRLHVPPKEGGQKDDMKNFMLEDIEKIIDNSAIDWENKKGLKRDVKVMLGGVLYEPMTDEIRSKINGDICNVIDAINMPEETKNSFKMAIEDALATELEVLLSEGQDVGDAINATAKNINKIIEGSQIPEDEKECLKRKLEVALTANLLRPMTNEVKETMIRNLSTIIDNSEISTDNKSDLKNQITAVVSKKFENLQIRMQLENDVKDSIIKELEKLIEELPISEEEKSVLRRKLIEMATETLKTPFLGDVQCLLKDGIKNIISELPLSKDEKAKLLNQFTNMIDDKMDSLNDETKGGSRPSKLLTEDDEEYIYQLEELETRTRDQILQAIEKSIDDLPISQEEKIELKRKLQEMGTETFKNLLSDDSPNALKDCINKILEELPLPTDMKNKLRNELTDTLDANIASLRDDIKRISRARASKDKGDWAPKTDARELELKQSILEGMEMTIDEAAISSDQKIELKKELKIMASENFNQPLTADSQFLLKSGISGILNRLSFPKDKKNKLKTQLIDVVDDTVKSSRGEKLRTEDDEEYIYQLQELETRTQDQILQGIEKSIDDSPLSKEKKIELKRKLQEMTTETFKNQLSDDSPNALKDGIKRILEELPLSTDKKNKLRNELTATVDANIASLRGDIKSTSRARASKDKRGLSPNADAKELELKESILEGMEMTIDEAAISSDQKLELKKELKIMASENFNQPLTADSQLLLKGGISGILNRLSFPKDKKNELKTQLIDVVDDTVKSSRGEKLRTEDDEEYIYQLEELETRTQDQILKGIEKSIDDSPVSKEKKIELKRKLQEMATETFKNQLSDDSPNALKDGINKILEELPLSTDKKNKLRNELTDTVDTNIASLRDDIKKTSRARAIKDKGGLSSEADTKELELKESILEGMEMTIDEAAISSDQKLELKKELKIMASENFNQPLTADSQLLLKGDISGILNRLSVPKDKKNELKTQLINVVDDTVKSSRGEKIRTEDDEEYMYQLEKLETRTQDQILQGIEKSIDDSPISKEKKIELKRKLQEMTTETFKNQLSDDSPDALKDGINKILEELPLSTDKKNKLRNDLTDTVDTNVASLRDDIKKTARARARMDKRDLSPKQEVKRTEVKDNILEGMETTINDAKISNEEKFELKKKLKEMAAEKFTHLSDDTLGSLKYGVSDILDQCALPEDKKRKLKNALNHMLDETMKPSQAEEFATESDEKYAYKLDELETRTQDKIMKGIEKSIDDSPVSKQKKIELKRELKEMAAKNFKNQLSGDSPNGLIDGINTILGKLPLSTEIKNNLHNELTDMVDTNMASLRDDRKKSSRDRASKDKRDLSPKQALKRSEVTDNILQGMERTISDAPISNEKKLELRKKLQEMAAEKFTHLSGDTLESLKYDFNDILDEFALPKDTKKNLKSQLNHMMDENIQSLRDEEYTSHVEELETHTQDKILKGIEKSIDDSPVSKQKKIELKRELKEMAAKNFKNQLSGDSPNAINDGIMKILDQLPISIDKKNKLKSDLTDMVDDNVASLKTKVKKIKSTQEKTKSAADPSGMVKEKRKSMIPEFKVDEAIQEEIKYVLDDSNISPSYLSTIQSNVFDDLEDLVFRGGDTENVKMKIKEKIMTDTNISDTEAKDLSNQLIGKAKEISLVNKAHDTDLYDKTMEIFSIPKRRLTELSDKEFIQSPEMIKVGEDSMYLIDGVICDTEDEKLREELLFKNVVRDLDSLPPSTDQINKLAIKVNEDKIKRTAESKSSRDGRSLSPKQEVKQSEVKDSILQGMERTINDAPISSNKKIELMKKLKEMAAEKFTHLSGDTLESMKYEFSDILDELTLPKDKKKNLKKELNHMMDKNIQSLRDEEYTSHVEELETNTQDNILKGIEKSIDDSPVSKQKKIELKRELKEMATKNFKNQLSGDSPNAINDGITKILDQLPLSTDKKNKLMSDLTDMVDDNVASLRDEIKRSSKPGASRDKQSLSPTKQAKELKLKNSILQGMEMTIDEAPITNDKKIELKTKLKEMAAENFEQPLSGDSVDLLKGGISGILDRLSLPADKKNKLKNQLIRMVDETIKSSQAEELFKESDEEYAYQLDELETRTQDRILEGIEKSIDDSPVSKQKKIELKRELKEMAAKNFKNQLSGDSPNAINDGITKILDQLPLSTDKKNKLKSDLTDMVDDNVASLKSEVKKIKSIQEKTKSAADPSVMVKEKRKSTVPEFKVDEAIQEEIKYVLDDSNIPTCHLSTIQSNVFEDLEDLVVSGGDTENIKIKIKEKIMNDTNISDTEAKDLSNKLIGKAKEISLVNKAHDTDLYDKTMENFSIPKSRLTELSNKEFIQSPEMIKLGEDSMYLIDGVICDTEDEKLREELLFKNVVRDLDSLPPSTDQINKLPINVYEDKIKRTAESKSSRDGRSLSPKQEVKQSEMKDSILQGMERTINDAPISNEKKIELTKKLKEMEAEKFTHLSGDTLESLKYEFNDILDELALPKDTKKNLKNELNHIMDKNIQSLHDEDYTSHVEELETNTQDKILEGIEKSIDDSPVSKQKKIELKRELKEMATKNFKNQLSGDSPNAINDGITKILDQLPLSTDKKNKLKSDLTDMVDDNIASLRDDIKRSSKPGASRDKQSLSPTKQAKELKLKNSILQGMKMTIDEAPISNDKKIELKTKLKEMAAETFEQPLSGDSVDLLKGGISGILDRLSLPADKKNKLKSQLLRMVDETIKSSHAEELFKESDEEYAYQLDELETRTQDRILGGIEKSIDDSPVSKQKKIELKMELKEMAAKNFKNQLSGDSPNAINDGITKILDQLPLSTDKKNKLKSDLTDMVDENVASLKSEVKKIKSIQEKTKSAADPSGMVKEKRKSMIPEFKVDEAIQEEIKYVLDDSNISPSDLSTIQSNVFDDLEDLVYSGGDTENVKMKIKEKIMNDTNISDTEAKDLSDKLIGKAKEISLVNKAHDTDLYDKTMENFSIPKRRLTELSDKEFIQSPEMIKVGEDSMYLIDGVICDTEDEKLREELLFKNVVRDLDSLPPSTDQINKLAIKVNEDKIKRTAESKSSRDGRTLSPKQEVKQSEVKDSILQGMERTINDAPISSNKKIELMKKLKEMAAEKFTHLSGDTLESLKYEFSDILDELTLPKDKKKILKNELNHMMDKNIQSLRDEEYTSHVEELETNTQDNILKGIEKSIDDSPVSKQKKIELKRELKEMATKNFKNQLSGDSPNAINDGITKILDQLPLSTDKKNKLKSDLTDMVDENIASLRDDIKRSSKPGGSRDKQSLSPTKQAKELKQKDDSISNGMEMTHTKKRLTELSDKECIKSPEMIKVGEGSMYLIDGVICDTEDEKLREELLFKNVIRDLDKLPPSTDQNNKLAIDLNEDDIKRTVKSKSSRDERTLSPKHEVNRSEMKDNVLRGMERTINDAPIPNENKNELTKKLKEMIVEKFTQLLPSLESLKNGVSNILDQFALPKDKKSKLKNDLNHMVDETMKPSHAKESATESDEEYAYKLDELETRTQDKILKGIEKSIDDSPVSKQKKIELKRELKEMAAQNFKNQLSGDSPNAIKDGITKILDQLPLSTDKKNKLKSDLTDMVDDNIASLRDDIKRSSKPGASRDKQSLSPTKQAKELKLKNSILQGMEMTIDEAPISNDKKNELKTKLKEMAAENFDQPLSGDSVDLLKGGISGILDRLSLPEDKKNKLKKQLLRMVDETIKSSHAEELFKESDEEYAYKLDELETRTQDKILEGIEKSIDDSPVSKQKKIELKRELKEMATKNFKNQLSGDSPNAIKDGITKILDQLPLPTDKKNKLKSDLTDMVDDNVASLRDEIKRSSKPGASRDKQSLSPTKQAKELKLKNSILQGMEMTIDEAPITNDKKIELKTKLKEMAAENFEQPLSGDSVDLLKGGISGILDRLSLPADKKNKLKNQLLRMVDETIKSSHAEELFKESDEEYAYQLDELETRTQDRILEGIEKSIDDSPVSKQKKIELKRELKEMAAKNFKNQLSGDSPNAINDGITKILDQLPLSTDKKNKLKSDLTDMVDDNVASLKSEVKKIKSTQEKTKSAADPSVMVKEKRKSMIPEFKVDEAIQEEIKYVLDDSNISPSHLSTIQSNVFDDLEDLVFSGGDTENVKIKIIEKIMTDTNISDTEAKDLSDKLIGKAKEISLVNKAHDTDLYDKTMENFSIPKRRLTELSDKEFIQSPEMIKVGEDSMYLIDGVKCDSDDDNIRDELLFKNCVIDIDIKRPSILKVRLHEVMPKSISNVIDQSSIPQAYKSSLKSQMTSHLGQTLDKSTLTKKKDIDDLKEEMIKKFDTILDESTIPKEKKKKLMFDLVEALNKDFDDICNVPDTSDSTDAILTTLPGAPRSIKDFTPVQASTPRASVQRGAAEQKYVHDVTNTIENWLDKMPTKLDPKVRTALTSNLANDVIDRQKYLQVNAGARTSKQDELENLKYQMFRRLSKGVAPEQMAELSREAEVLLKDMKEIEVPADVPMVEQPWSKEITTDEETLPDEPKSKWNFIPGQTSTPKKVGKTDVFGKADEFGEADVFGKADVGKADVFGKADVGKADDCKFCQKHEKARQEYTDNLKNTVKTWLDTMPIDLNPEDETAVIQDLVSDILDRQEYLKRNPGARTSNQEELANMKFHVFRRLSNFVPPEDMLSVTQKTEELLRNANELEVPRDTPHRHFAERKERKHKKKRRSDSKTQRSTKSIDSPSPNASMRTQSSNEYSETQDKQQAGSDPASGFTYKADEDSRDTHSMKIDVINVPKDPRPSIIKRQLKDNLCTSMDKVIDEANLTKIKKQNLKEKLHNIIEKDLDKSLLAHKKDLDSLKQVAINDINEVLDELPKANVKFLKPRLAEVLDAGLQESALHNTFEANERLSKELSDLIKPLRLSLVEKCDLKDRLANMININTQDDTENTEGYSFQKKFDPAQHSSMRKDTRGSEPSSPTIDRTETSLTSRDSQVPPETTEAEYTQQIKQAVGSWVKESPSLLQSKDRETFIRGLSNDILDRKKYLQVNARAPPSKEEELDQLKYQLYKRLNKMADVDDVAPVIEKTDGLLKKVQKLNVPFMKVPPGFVPREDSDTEKERRSTARTSQAGRTVEPPRYQDEQRKSAEQKHTGIREDRTAMEGELMNTLEELAAQGADDEAIREVLLEKIGRMSKMSEDEAELLTQQLLNKPKEKSFSKHSPKEKDSRKKSTRISEVITSIKPPAYGSDENVINVQKITGEDSSALEAELMNTLQELAAKGADDETIRKALMGKTARMSKMSEKEAEALTQQFLDKVKEKPLTSHAQGTSQSAQRPSKSPTPHRESKVTADITENVNDWIATLPITINNPNEKKAFDNEKKGFISKLREVVPKPRAVKKETKKFMLEVPLDPEMKQNQGFLNQKADELAENLAFVVPRSRERRHGMSFRGLSDFVENWVDDINIEDETKDQEEIKRMKKNIASDLIHRMGQMNVDPEIFNDVALYEDVLTDELNNLLENVTIADENFESKKEDLLDKVIEAQQRAHDEIAGQNYKQQLRETVAEVLPDAQTLSPEEEANLKIMKDQLADAFINLHYSGNDEKLKNELKTGISNEINKFSKDYLKRHPDTSLDNKRLKEDLYDALKNVPLPADDSMRYEVEQVRIRDEINKWIKELPLEPQSPEELLARNPMIYVLSKKLFDIGVDMDETAGTAAMQKEIERFLKKMPLEPGQERHISDYAEHLIDALKASEASRTFSESTISQIDERDKIPRVSAAGRGSRASDFRGGVAYGRGVTDRDAKGTGVLGRGSKGTGAIGAGTKGKGTGVTGAGTRGTGYIGAGTKGAGVRPGTSTSGTMCPYYKSLKEQQQIFSREQPGQEQYESYAPCTLTEDDIAHLERIRERSCLTPHCISSLIRGKRSAGVGPQAKDAGSQTDLTPESYASQTQSYRPCGRQASRTCPGIPMIQSDYLDRRTTSSDPFTQADSRGEVQPQIIVKEYYWDAPEEEAIQESELIQPSQPQQSYTQRIPCDHSLPCSRPKVQRCPHFAQKPCQMPQNRSSCGMLPCHRQPCTPSPCTSPFAANQQSTPVNSGTPNKTNEYKKRDGLQDQTQPTTSRGYRRERVIELGSLDDLCEARPKKRCDNFDWSYAKFPEEDNFWGTPCMRRVILDEGIDEPLMMEREKREERVRCRCKERLVPKFSGSRSRTCNQSVFHACNEDPGNLNRCSKCCGVHCPYPSYLYFK